MTVTRIPHPPRGLDPTLSNYLYQLVSDVQTKLNDLDNTSQQLGRNVRLPLITYADIIGGNLKIRPIDYPVLAWCPDLPTGDAGLIVTDGTYTRPVTLGPPIT